MANLTITIDPALLRLARVRAVREGTSVNAILRDYLQGYAVEQESNARLADDFDAAWKRASAAATAKARRRSTGAAAPAKRASVYDDRVAELERRRRK